MKAVGPCEIGLAAGCLAHDRAQALIARGPYPLEQFSHSQSQAAVSAMLARILVCGPKEIIMEYLIVLVTATMVALYALIIERSLPRT
jgi:hypothetical protein